MNAIQNKLDEIFDLIVANELPYEQFTEFRKFEIALDEVEQYILPFLKRLRSYKNENMDNDNFIIANQVIEFFTSHYFNEIKENGYYKGVQLTLLNDWLCLNCEEFFYLTDNNIEMDKICCTYCGSKSYRHSTKIQKARIDGLSVKEIIAKFNLKTTDKNLIKKGTNDININFN